MRASDLNSPERIAHNERWAAAFDAFQNMSATILGSALSIAREQRPIGDLNDPAELRKFLLALPEIVCTYG